MGSELGVTADSKAAATITPVSIWWACFACFWTVAVGAGMAYLIINRNAPTLRIRGIGLSLLGIGVLHLYLVSVQFGVMIGTLMPGNAEFWIMGIYLPCGIALFHASNTRFLHVANSQKKFVQPCAPAPKGNGWFARFQRLPYTTKMLIIVGLVMFSQVFLTCLMYIISRKWHSSWGIPGTEVHGSPMQQKMEMGRGWEWWPTVFWQFFWAWIVAPVLLWKSRNIHDSQGWRVQTIGCALANLHATPMWLIGMYVPAMEKVNQYWLPPQWICLSIFFMEIFTVFLPCWEVVRHRSLRQETLDAIEQWETKTKGTGIEAKSVLSSSTLAESIVSGWKSTDGSVKTNHSRESILTMSALEYVLERNPAPLQEFAALHDFSGENIAFLTSVAEWKSSLPKEAWENSIAPKGDNMVRERFNRALYIYTHFVGVQDAEFPVNVSSQDLKKLENVFEDAARATYGDRRDVDPVTPFEDRTFFSEPDSPVSSDGSEKAMHRSMSAATKPGVQYSGEIPKGFDETVFDDAEKSIKYLVLTNTWPKFIKSWRNSISSSEGLNTSTDAV